MPKSGAGCTNVQDVEGITHGHAAQLLCKCSKTPAQPIHRGLGSTTPFSILPDLSDTCSPNQLTLHYYNHQYNYIYIYKVFFKFIYIYHHTWLYIYTCIYHGYSHHNYHPPAYLYTPQINCHLLSSDGLSQKLQPLSPYRTMHHTYVNLGQSSS